MAIRCIFLICKGIKHYFRIFTLVLRAGLVQTVPRDVPYDNIRVIYEICVSDMSVYSNTFGRSL